MNEQELARREAALREKEAELSLREAELAAAEAAGQPSSGTAPDPKPGDTEDNGPAGSEPGTAQNSASGNGAGTPPRRPIEGLYDHIHIPLWLLDAIIVGCIIAFFVVVAVGALKGRGML